MDDADLNLVLERYGQSCTGCPKDLNDDGIVDDTDLGIVLETFGLNAWQWQYDALGRVVAAQSCGSAYQCAYDALGRRIWQSLTTSGSISSTSSGTQTTCFLYGPGFEIELDDEGNVKAETAFGLLGPIARWTTSGDKLWYVSDGSGSARVLLSEGATDVTIAARYHYEALGGMRGDSEPDNFHQPYRLAAASGARWEPGLGGAFHPQGGVYVAELATPQKAPLFMPEGGLGIPQFSWEELFDNVGWFLTGYGDNVSLGITGLFRHSTGLGNVVPYHSASYKAGYMTATGVNLALSAKSLYELGKAGYHGVRAAIGGYRAARAGKSAAEVARATTQAAPQAAKLADDCGEVAYHYTTQEAAEGIIAGGYDIGMPGTMYVTPDGRLSSLQAVIDLALPPNKPYGAVLEVDLARLRVAGFKISDPRTVSPANRQPGGGIEIMVEFLERIPKEFFRRVR